MGEERPPYERGPTPDPDAVLAIWSRMGITEPGDGVRSMTALVREFYSGLVMAGFDHDAALELTKPFVTAMTTNATNRNKD